MLGKILRNAFIHNNKRHQFPTGSVKAHVFFMMHILKFNSSPNVTLFLTLQIANIIIKNCMDIKLIESSYGF